MESIVNKMEIEFKGLTSSEAAQKLKTFGSNSLQPHHENIFITFIKEFLSPLIYLLIIAAILSFALGNYTDGLIILIIIFINSILGFFQQYRVNKEFEKLSSFITSNVDVLRDGEKKSMKKSLLVPGDIIFLKLGDIVPADCYVLKTDDLSVDESAMTGESAYVFKVINLNEDSKNSEGVLYSGTNIVKGVAVAKVFATATNSKFGQIAELSLKTKKVSEYEQNLKNLSKRFLLVSFVALVFIFLSHAFIKRSDNLIDILLFTVAISITIIPEALPIVANLTLSRSASKLGKVGVIVKRASAVEDLGNIDLICTDKTGTLTKNINTVQSIHFGKDKDNFYKYLYLLSLKSQDALDLAIQKYLSDNKYNPKQEVKELIDSQFEDFPFDPVTKHSSRKFENLEIIKGASEYIHDISKYENKGLKEYLQKNEKSGLRSISIALKNGNKSEYLGTLFLADEIKETASETIRRAEKLGIKVKVITGDSTEVSTYVGLQVNLIKNEFEVIESKDLTFDDPLVFEEQVAAHKIFTRCDPVQKYKILEALQKKHFLGYLGDGINDSPSLKLANVSIVVNAASDIAKENADLVLLTKNLKVIIDGVYEGRKAFENIDKYLRQTLAGNFGNFFTIGMISLFVSYLPMLPIQILISNLLTDIPSLAISSDNVERDELLKPKSHNLNIVIRNTFWLAVLSSVFDLGFFLIIFNYPIAQVQTLWFAFSTISEIAVLISLRSKKDIFSRMSHPSFILGFSIVLTLALSLLLITLGSKILSIEKIDYSMIFVILFLTLLYVFANEVLKKIIWRQKIA